MAAALECWCSSRSSSSEMDEQQVLMRSHHPRSEAGDASSNPTSGMQKRLQKLSRNVSEAINSLKNSLNLDTPPDAPRKLVWTSIVRSLTPGDRLVSSIRKHFDSMPSSYAQAGFDMKDVLLHIKLMEQACVEDHPALFIQDLPNQACLLNLTFACNSTISWPALSAALETASVSCNNIHIFQKKGSTLGILHILVQPGLENNFKIRVENALRSASKKPKLNNRKLPFGLCGCQEENGRAREFREMEEAPIDQNYRDCVEHTNPNIQLQLPLPSSTFVLSVDEWQTLRVCREEVGTWLLNSDTLDFTHQIGPSSFKGVYKGRRVAIEKLKGCDKGNAYDFEIRKDLLELMTCGHRNVVPFYGVCVDEIHGLCVVTRFMEGGSVHDLMLKHKKFQMKDVVRIAIDVAEGIKFMNDHGVSYQDLNTMRILLDRQGNACLGDMGIVRTCKSSGEAMEYETDGYRWLAPEIIAADPESVSETWMSNVYSFAMVIWEMVTGEAAYSVYSPVQAAVGIAACGLRPEIPKECPQVLKSLMTKCWNNCPSKRPQFSEILSVLQRPSNLSTVNNR